MRPLSPGSVGVERLDGRHQHVDAHEHSASAAVGRVVDAPVLAQTEVARIAQPHGELVTLDAAADEARREEPLEQLGKQCDDVDSHRGGSLAQRGLWSRGRSSGLLDPFEGPKDDQVGVDVHLGDDGVDQRDLDRSAAVERDDLGSTFEARIRAQRANAPSNSMRGSSTRRRPRRALPRRRTRRTRLAPAQESRRGARTPPLLGARPRGPGRRRSRASHQDGVVPRGAPRRRSPRCLLALGHAEQDLVVRPSSRSLSALYGLRRSSPWIPCGRSNLGQRHPPVRAPHRAPGRAEIRLGARRGRPTATSVAPLERG